MNRDNEFSLIRYFFAFIDSQIGNVDNDVYQENFPSLYDIVAQKCAKTCSVKGLKRRLPITEWLPKYQGSFFIQDFVAGISVGLTAIPQGLSRD
jgi:solute carrier family 26 (sodium-independent sulfate anion transporter), member 11